MRELSKRLATISKGDGDIRLKEARVIISKLRAMNLRWNIDSLDRFLLERQKDLLY